MSLVICVSILLEAYSLLTKSETELLCSVPVYLGGADGAFKDCCVFF